MLMIILKYLAKCKDFNFTGCVSHIFHYEFPGEGSEYYQQFGWT